MMNKENLIDLDKKQLSLLDKIIKQHVPNKTVWAYGSRVTWKANEISDLDLVVFDCISTDISNFKEALEESNLLISVDVMDWENIPDNFKKTIREKYVALQEKLGLDGWREVKLVDVAEKVAMGPFGSNIKVETFKTEGIPIISGQHLHETRLRDSEFNFITEEHADKLSNSNVFRGDVVFTHAGNIGQVSFIPENSRYERYVLSQRQFYLRCDKEKIDHEFIAYYFRSSYGQHQILAHSSQTGVPSLAQPATSIKNLEILLPPLPEQKAIAEVLSSLDDKIDLLRRQNKTLEDMAQTFFRQWFVEEVDDKWETKKISDEFYLTMGQSPPGSSYNESQKGTPMFQGNADFDFRFPKNRIYTTEPTRFAEKFDTLISVRAPVGEQNMAAEKCCIGRGVAAFRYKEDKSFYTYTYFKLMSLMDRVKQYNQEGTVFGSISKNDLESFSITIPPIRLVTKFQNTAKPLDDKIISNQSQIHTLENLRDTLLPKLMRGQCKVKINA